MGRIAANHALSDLYASGARPVSALAFITLPFSAPEIQQRELKQLLAGALYEFSAVGCQLLGGHTMQGTELCAGFVVNGAPPDEGSGFLSKRGLRDGDHLLLTKALGTGTLFAQHMQLGCDGRNIQQAINAMLQSNAAASTAAIARGVSACTDVTGFGLAGHLMEMLLPGQSAVLELDQLPVLPGALQSIGSVRSTMHEANYCAVSASVEVTPENKTASFELLFDPQTSGGLLMGVSPGESAELCAALVEAGCTQAAVIGVVRAVASGQPPGIVVV